MNFSGFNGNNGKSSPVLSDEERQMKMINTAMESCVFKSLMATVAGFGLGGVFGLFMSSMTYDVPGERPIHEKPFKEQFKLQFKDMGKRAFSSAKGFGKVGGIYSAVECCIESFRAKNDIWNSASAGCITGGTLALNAGPQAACIGCLGFAAFSSAIHAYMES